MSEASSAPETVEQSTAPKIRVVFMGTPNFARTQLEALLANHYEIVGVVTQPDRPVGREQTIEQCPVKQLAEEHSLPVFQPAKLDAAAIDTIKDWKPDLIVVAAYGRILPKALLELPGFGCVNVHASLLPRWRGASPIQNALMAGDTETGITLMLLDEGMDTGPLLARRAIPIDPQLRADTLTDALATLGGTLLIETLPSWIERTLKSTPQPADGVTLCQLIEREDGRLFWDATAIEIFNRYRGLYPWPGVFTFWKRGEHDLVRIKLLEIRLQKLHPDTERPFGTVFQIGDDIGVQTAAGVIFIDTLQPEGKSAVSVQDFLRGNPSFIGGTLVS